MESNRIETGLQLFSRLNQPFKLENLHEVLFENGGPFPNEFIEIAGGFGTGKSVLLMDLIARCILPHSYNDHQMPGKNCGAVIINTNHHFDILKLIDIMGFLIKGTCQISSVDLKSIIETSLKNLTILNCYDSQQLQMTFYNLERILLQNLNIALITLNTTLAYYWEYRITNGLISIQAYCAKMLSILESNIKNSNVVVIFTKTDTETKNMNENYSHLISSKIWLKKIENDTFEAHVINNSNAKKIFTYSIDTTLTFIAPSVESKVASEGCLS